MRTITHLVVHCSATPQETTVESIKNYWRTIRKWQYPGYHFIIKANGEIVQLLDISLKSNGVEGRNSTLINICYIGGIDSKSKPTDNRTTFQRFALVKLLRELKEKFPTAIIQGHRDFPGVKKDCPCFNAKTEYSIL